MHPLAEIFNTTFDRKIIYEHINQYNGIQRHIRTYGANNVLI